MLVHASHLHSLAPLGKPSARLGGPVRQSVVHSRLAPQLPRSHQHCQPGHSPTSSCCTTSSSSTSTGTYDRPYDSNASSTSTED